MQQAITPAPGLSLRGSPQNKFEGIPLPKSPRPALSPHGPPAGPGAPAAIQKALSPVQQAPTRSDSLFAEMLQQAIAPPIQTLPNPNSSGTDGQVAQQFSGFSDTDGRVEPGMPAASVGPAAPVSPSELYGASESVTARGCSWPFLQPSTESSTARGQWPAAR